MTELADMRQLTLASASFDKHSKQTRRAKFLAEMDQVVPWREPIRDVADRPRSWERFCQRSRQAIAGPQM